MALLITVLRPCTKAQGGRQQWDQVLVPLHGAIQQQTHEAERRGHPQEQNLQDPRLSRQRCWVVFGCSSTAAAVEQTHHLTQVWRCLFVFCRCFFWLWVKTRRPTGCHFQAKRTSTPGFTVWRGAGRVGSVELHFNQFPWLG